MTDQQQGDLVFEILEFLNGHEDVRVILGDTIEVTLDVVNKFVPDGWSAGDDES